MGLEKMGLIIFKNKTNMKVEINGHTCTIGWQYESKVINKALAKWGADRREPLKGLTKKRLAWALGLKSYPLPDSTHCIITDTVTGDVYTGTVKRFHKDPWSREMARKNSLTKALWQLFPETKNPYSSEQRKKFWNAYHGRKMNNPMTNIEKAIKKGLFTKEDISAYNTLHCSGYSENVY